MTGRIGSMSIDGTLISEADVARIEHEEELHKLWQRKAARVVASGAQDLDDCRQLLSMLGLDRDVLVEAVSEVRSGAAKTAPAKSARKRRAARPHAA